jgi:hypothetical protein
MVYRGNAIWPGTVPCHLGRGCGGALEPQAAEEPLCLQPTWTADERSKRSSLERFFGRMFSIFSRFRLQRHPLCGRSAVA